MSFDFHDLIPKGREIDEGITKLRTKLLEPQQFGNGREAHLALKELRKEIAFLEKECLEEIDKKNEEYTRVVDINQKVNQFLNESADKLDKLEISATKYGYRPYESLQKENDINESNSFSSDQTLLTPINTSHNPPRKLQFNDDSCSYCGKTPQNVGNKGFFSMQKKRMKQ